MQLTTSDYAELGTWLHGIERTGPRSLRIVDDEPLRLYKTWVTLIALTRSIREQDDDERVALVTGAAGGIGSAIAARLAQRRLPRGLQRSRRGRRRARGLRRSRARRASAATCAASTPSPSCATP